MRFVCFKSPSYILLIVIASHVYPQECISFERTQFDSITTEKQYLMALKVVDESTFRQQFEEEFLLLLNNRQIAYYNGLSSLGERKGYIENYWRAVNPNPILPENDVLLEHLRRRNYARVHFRTNDPPYFDDRGKYYLRYGKPSVRYQDTGGLKQVAVSWRDDPNADYMVRVNESWSYENVARDFVVHFAQFGNRFREIESLTEIIISPRRRSKQALQWSDLIKKRASISPALGRVAAQLEQIESAVLLGNEASLLSSDTVMPNERIFKIEKENKREIVQAVREAPRVAHDPVHAINQLELVHQIEQFGEENGLTRVEITLLSPLKKNFLDKDAHLDKYEVSVEFRGLLRDSYLLPVAEDASRRAFLAKFASRENLPNAVGILTFFAPPSPFELTLQIKDVFSNTIGFSKQLLNIRDFRPQELMMSDIQFYTEVKNENQKQVLPTKQKQGFEIAPYPFLKVLRSIPLYCYFEIYHLKSAGITNEYEITYRIMTSKGEEDLVGKLSNLLSDSKDVALSISYSQPVGSESSEEFISIDLSKLSSGPHLLEIVVRAKNDTTIMASAQRTITVVD